MNKRTIKRLISFLFTSGFLFLLSCNTNYENTNQQTPLVKEADSIRWKITAPPDSLKLDPFYKQYVLVNGIPVICSHRVTKEAVYKACNIINFMTSVLPPEVLNEMVKRHARLGIMARYEGTTDIPEHRHLANDTSLNWDVRARGLGGDTETPLTTCAEENLLGFVIDKYHAEDITIHEFAHAIHLIGIAPRDSSFNTKLQIALDAALNKGKWVNTYAGTDIYEYWAEGVQSWFNVNAEVAAPDGKNSPINTREELKEYDQALYQILSTFFPEVTEQISCHSVPFTK
ncbi:MAG: hypothetical protein M0P66_14195 [Salinivirgaceae bacterium]|nr:hypothetical protein [Salinivirgaceae bacterium]